MLPYPPRVVSNDIRNWSGLCLTQRCYRGAVLGEPSLWAHGGGGDRSVVDNDRQRGGAAADHSPRLFGTPYLDHPLGGAQVTRSLNDGWNRCVCNRGGVEPCKRRGRARTLEPPVADETMDDRAVPSTPDRSSDTPGIALP